MKFSLKKVIGWCLYDFANTIFSAVILTFYFPLYLTARTGSNWTMGAATTAAMLLAGSVTPFLGALSDRTGKTKRYLLIVTLGCILFASLLSFVNAVIALTLCFLLACFFFHASLVFYNALLPVAAPPERRGLVSGMGVALGYLGVVCVLPLMNWVHKNWGEIHVFWVSGVLFLLFSLPLFFFVPERSVFKPEKLGRALFFMEWRDIFKTIRSLGARPKLLLFLAGNFFLVDAVNSSIAWFAVYSRNVFHPEQSQLVTLMMGMNIAAFLAGLLCGYLTDRFGASKIVLCASVSLCGMLILMTQPLTFGIFMAVALGCGGFALAGIWTAGRELLLELSPPAHYGKYLGLYGLTLKVSVLGSLLYGITSDVAGMRAGLWILVFPAVAGLGLLAWSSMLRPDVYNEPV